jgi:hypothetical protein
MDGYIAKPIKGSDLAGVLRRAVVERGAPRDGREPEAVPA